MGTPFPAPANPPAPVPSASQLVADAILALNYCASNGVTVEEQIVDDITNAAATLAALPPAQVPPTLKTSVYASVARLEDLKSRVNISIRASGSWDLQRKLSYWEEIWFSRFFQSYASMAQTFFLLIAVVISLILYQAQANLYLGRSLYASLEQLKSPDTAPSTNSQSTSSAPPSNTIPGASLDTSGQRIAEYDANEELLDRWTEEFKWLPLSLVIPSFLTENRPSQSSPSGPSASSNTTPQATNATPEAAPANVSIEQDTKSQQKQFPVYQFIIDLLNSYICPCLGGILGSTVYVLRMINVRSIKHDLSDRCVSTYLIRLVLGGIFGVVITWFTGASAPDSWKSLPPLALSFMTGYNIELVFTAMDKLIGAFSPSSPSTLQENHPRG